MMTKKQNLSKTALKTLTTMALALPGIQGIRAEGVTTKPQTDLRYTRYDEGKLHYQIDIYQAMLAFALSHKMDMVVKASQNVMTGASSYGYLPEIMRVPGGSGTQLVAARSGSSIQNKRSVGDVNVRYFGDDYNIGVGVGLSEECFYESKTFHVQYEQELNKSNTVISTGYSVSNDSIFPTPQAATDFFPVVRVNTRQSKVTQRAYLDAKQDLSNTSLVQVGVEFIADKGYLNDPYKAIVIYGNPNRNNQLFLPVGAFGNPYDVTVGMESRPDYRASLATSARFIQYITPLKSSIHVGFRFAKNTWNIKSYTFDVSYHQELGDSWQVVPSARYYTQSEAYFYSMFFDAIGTSPIPSKPIGSIGPASSDYRLGKFGSIAGELKVHYQFLENQAAKLTLVGGVINRRNQLYWGRKPYPFNPDNDFKTYYGSLGISFVF